MCTESSNIFTLFFSSTLYDYKTIRSNFELDTMTKFLKKYPLNN